MVTRVPLKGIHTPDCPGVDDALCCVEPVSEFRVDVGSTSPPRPKYVHFYNLCDECVEVLRRWDGKCCDDYEAPWLCNGSPVVLTQCNPELLLVVPGRYIFRTQSGEPYDFDSVGVEVDYIDPEFARLRLEQHSLCCCNKSDCIHG